MRTLLIVTTEIEKSVSYDSVTIILEHIDILVLLTEYEQHRSNVFLCKPIKAHTHQRKCTHRPV